ncbi:MAG: hypothetical protein OEW42_17595 [Acidimicrobiia bacterium]|nr:hypothetical protein [Acidimicrobiia bacterium]
MDDRSAVMPGIGLVAAVVAGISVILEWGATDRGTHHGLEDVGGSFFGVMVVLGAVLGAVVAVSGLVNGDRAVGGGRLQRSHLLMAAGGAVIGPALAFVLSPTADYTAWKPSGIGGWLAAAMGVVMLLAGLGWARRRPVTEAASVSHEVDRSFGIGLLVVGIVGVLVPFFAWLSLEVSADTTFRYGAFQGGLRGVGIIAFASGVLTLLAGAWIVYRFDRPVVANRGGLGAEHLGLAAAATGLSTAIAFMLSIIRTDFDQAVDPGPALYLYLFAILLAGFFSLTALLVPGAPETDARGEDPHE